MSESELKQVDALAPAGLAPAANAKPVAYKRCGPGESISDPRPGDIIVVEPHYMRVNHFTPGGKLVAQWGIKGTNAAEFILPRSIGLSSA